MFRLAALFALLAVPTAPAPEFVQAVEFPYYSHPRALWERELVWLKNIGIRTVAFSVGHTPPKSDPRADLPGFLRILRRLGLRAWIYDVPQSLSATLEMQLERHGGPIAFVEGPSGLQAPAPPAPVTRLSATNGAALFRSRDIFAANHGSLLWQDMEDTLSPTLRRGVVSFSRHDEREGSRRAPARRRYPAALLGCDPARTLHKPSESCPAKSPRPQLLSSSPRGASAILVTNRTAAAFTGPLRAYDPSVAREMILPKLSVPPGESLWLPVNISLAKSGLCEDCASFPPGDRIVYATAELESVEFENGILAFEFSAPTAGEVVIQLARTRLRDR